MKWALAGLVLIVLAGFGLKWALEERARTAPPEPKVHVQSAWAMFRRAPGHQKHVAEMKLDCAACHTMVDGGADRPGPERCATCHEDQATLHHGLDSRDPGDAGESDGIELAQCTACHGFGPDPKQTPRDCLRCHGEAQGDTPPVTIHAKDDCLGCHTPHEDRVEARACGECHQVKVEHGKAHAAGQQAACTTCHDPHAPASVASDRCASCHGATGVKPMPATAGHANEGCAACHTDHRFTRSSVQACQSCHVDQHALPGKGHTACTSCHDPHALGPSAEATRTCVQCHKKVSPAHGAAMNHGSKAGPTECTGCHVPHPPSNAPPRVACTDCHDLAPSETTAHAADVSCSACHAPHDFDADAATSCRSCHARRLTELAHHKGHAECASCHSGLPHLAGTEPRTCQSCHTNEAHVVNQGHAECSACHETHATGMPRAACASCHGDEAENVGHGHAVCSNCHETHSGARKDGVENCSSCHKAGQLPGMHRVTEHQSCASCHSVHGEALPGAREACLNCHEEQRDHQPEATMCNGCHTFRGPGFRRPR